MVEGAAKKDAKKSPKNHFSTSTPLRSVPVLMVFFWGLFFAYWRERKKKEREKEGKGIFSNCQKFSGVAFS